MSKGLSEGFSLFSSIDFLNMVNLTRHVVQRPHGKLGSFKLKDGSTNFLSASTNDGEICLASGLLPMLS